MKNKILVVNGMCCNGIMSEIGDVTNEVEEFTRNPKNFKLVLFTGGEDVTPKLYGHKSPKGLCRSSLSRDMEEMEIFSTALLGEVLCAGICRGFQFLNVMAGGTLIHHASNHGGSVHDVTTVYGENFEVNSLHHQIVVPTEENSDVIAWSKNKISSYYYGDMDEKIEDPDKEVEAAVFKKINSIGVQWHPEFLRRGSEGYNWFLEFVDSFLGNKTVTAK
jgi:gamma-glutamyl-gamma-aminobutyrate hydrolase PuuD